MLKKLEKSWTHGRVKVVSIVGQSVPGTAALIGMSKLYFWPDNAPENKQIFDLLGIEKSYFQSDHLKITIVNSVKKTLEMRFDTLD